MRQPNVPLVVSLGTAEPVKWYCVCLPQCPGEAQSVPLHLRKGQVALAAERVACFPVALSVYQ